MQRMHINQKVRVLFLNNPMGWLLSFRFPLPIFSGRFTELFVVVQIRGALKRGWQLIWMLSNMIKASDLLDPYVKRFLHYHAQDRTKEYWDLAVRSEERYRKTSRIGGRKVVPQESEIYGLEVRIGSPPVDSSAPFRLWFRLEINHFSHRKNNNQKTP
jgi:hypothetical protein